MSAEQTSSRTSTGSKTKHFCEDRTLVAARLAIFTYRHQCQYHSGRLKSRILAHKNPILSAQSVGNRCDDWDVINEIVLNNDYANKLKGSPGLRFCHW
ncbi:MAG: hypothetical protein IPN72_06835 [Saprospiraceae bacterium]|nr:hypothetical protein [Saprospiraceae bacterium]